MNICIFSKADESGGGASRVAAETATLLEKTQGISVKRFSKTDNPKYLDLRGKGLNRIFYRLSKAFSRIIGLPDILTSEMLNIKRPEISATNIFHIHDISSALSPLTLKQLSTIAPVVWTLHDCSPFTGGCIYPITCTNFINGNCSNCPQLHEWPLRSLIDLTKTIQALKLNIINNNIKKVICPSNWIATQAIAAGIDKRLIAVIHNGVDINTFYPMLKTKNEQLCILLSSVDLESRFKGTHYAIDIINNLKINVKILIVGGNGNKLKSRISSNHEIHILEQTFDKNKLAFYYRQSDILIHTSIADNCPLTILESLASGVPVVAFDTGGIPELIEHNINGWITNKFEHATATSIIEELHEDREKLSLWKSNARQTAENKFNLSIFLQRHLTLYQSILD